MRIHSDPDPQFERHGGGLRMCATWEFRFVTTTGDVWPKDKDGNPGWYPIHADTMGAAYEGAEHLIIHSVALDQIESVR